MFSILVPLLCVCGIVLIFLFYRQIIHQWRGCNSIVRVTMGLNLLVLLCEISFLMIKLYSYLFGSKSAVDSAGVWLLHISVLLIVLIFHLSLILVLLKRKRMYVAMLVSLFLIFGVLFALQLTL